LPAKRQTVAGLWGRGPAASPPGAPCPRPEVRATNGLRRAMPAPGASWAGTRCGACGFR